MYCIFLGIEVLSLIIIYKDEDFTSKRKCFCIKISGLNKSEIQSITQNLLHHLLYLNCTHNILLAYVFYNVKYFLLSV